MVKTEMISGWLRVDTGQQAGVYRSGPCLGRKLAEAVNIDRTRGNYDEVEQRAHGWRFMNQYLLQQVVHMMEMFLHVSSLAVDVHPLIEYCYTCGKK
jgi:hypothetical protein